MKKLSYLFVISCLICFCTLAKADSYSRFFHAVVLDDVGTVDALLQRGFDPNSTDEQGNSALMLALRNASPHVFADLLRQPGIDLDHTNAFGENALMYASLLGRLDAVRALLDAGAQVNKTGWTALAYASSQGRLDVVRELLKRHAQVDAAAPNGSTPLMLAVYYGHRDVVDVLLNHGADPDARNLRGHSAIDLARERGFDRIAADLHVAEAWRQPPAAGASAAH